METLIAYGGAVKALETAEDGTVTVGGYLVRFGSPEDTDLEGDFFSAKTNFGPTGEDGARLGVFYHHGLDGVMQKRMLGVGTVSRKDAGLWLEAQLEARDDYEKKLLDLIAAGKAGYSSGAPPWLVDGEPLTIKGKQVRHITQWLPGEASITPIPAEHRNTVALKSLTADDGLADAFAAFDAALKAINDRTEAALFERMASELDSLIINTTGRTA